MVARRDYFGISVEDPRWDKRGRTTPWKAGKLARDSIEAPLDSCWKPLGCTPTARRKSQEEEKLVAQLHCTLHARCV
ncbi:unnamed protein product [Prunus armeniaca]